MREPMELSKVALLRKADPKKGQSQRGMSDAFVISDIAERAAGGYDRAIDQRMRLICLERMKSFLC